MQSLMRRLAGVSYRATAAVHAAAEGTIGGHRSDSSLFGARGETVPLEHRHATVWRKDAETARFSVSSRHLDVAALFGDQQHGAFEHEDDTLRPRHSLSTKKQVMRQSGNFSSPAVQMRGRLITKAPRANRRGSVGLEKV